MTRTTFRNVELICPNGAFPGMNISLEGDAIAESEGDVGDVIIDGDGCYLTPGFVDLHVHGGGGADFMDLTADAFRTVAECHARHGTTALTPTSTVGTKEQYRKFCELNRDLKGTANGGARFLGGHLYGPYFRPEAKGCHPTGDFLDSSDLDAFGELFAIGGIRTLTIAPELPGAEALTRIAVAAGMLVTAGHSYATFVQMEAAVNWGVSHIDHLFCAMSDRARLRVTQSFPVRAGVMEATLAHDELTTEVIADGVHLDPGLLRFAHRMKGTERLALVTDSMRAVDCPDGEYWFGAEAIGERIQKRGHAGLTLDGKSLASSVVGMDHCVRTMVNEAGVSLVDAVAMASTTPARILGLAEHGLNPGCKADLVLLDRSLQVRQTWVGGIKVYDRDAAKPSR